jgi:hypothetical protein
MANAESIKITLFAIMVEIEFKIHDKTIVLHLTQARKEGLVRDGLGIVLDNSLKVHIFSIKISIIILCFILIPTF